MITGIAHVNLIVPPGTLHLAESFYGETLGLHRVAVPARQKDMLAWFDITPKGQQVHIALGPKEAESPRHPCFRLESIEALAKLQQKIWEHYQRGDASAPRMADKPGGENSGSKSAGFPPRFFARDYAGNRLEFSL